jgi:hypothetical protein
MGIIQIVALLFTESGFGFWGMVGNPVFLEFLHLAS